MSEHVYQLARQIGRIEAIMEDYGRRLSKLESPARAKVPWRELLPYLYGVAMVAVSLIMVAAGKISVSDVLLNFLGKH